MLLCHIRLVGTIIGEMASDTAVHAQPSGHTTGAFLGHELAMRALLDHVDLHSIWVNNDGRARGHDVGGRR